VRTLPPPVTLPKFINGRRVVEWRRWARLDDTHDVAVPIVQVGRGRAVQFVADHGGAIKVPRVATVAVPSPQQSSGIGTLLGIGLAIVGGVAIYQSWKRGQRSADIIHGYASEDLIADDLEHTWGGAVDVSPGSRGAADLDARLPIGRFAIQAKSSRRGEARWPRPAEIARLTQLARRRRARAVVALRSRTKTTFHDARTREPIDL
jgi:hypothetical protein